MAGDVDQQELAQQLLAHNLEQFSLADYRYCCSGLLLGPQHGRSQRADHRVPTKPPLWGGWGTPSMWSGSVCYYALKPRIQIEFLSRDPPALRCSSDRVRVGSHGFEGELLVCNRGNDDVRQHCRCVRVLG